MGFSENYSKNKIKEIIIHLKLIATSSNIRTASRIEELIEDLDIQEYILGEWGIGCLPFDIEMALKISILEFLNIFNSHEKVDSYCLKNENDLAGDQRFLIWKEQAQKVISIVDEYPLDCSGSRSQELSDTKVSDGLYKLVFNELRKKG